jgi:hypothetical protein
MKLRVALLLASLGVSAAAFAGSTGSTLLHTPQGRAAGTPNGDYVSDTAGLGTFYRYFVEVPAGVDRLQIEIFDADVGAGGTAEALAGRDRTRDAGGVYSTSATYSLIDPAGTTRTPRFTSGTTAAPVGGDNAWLVFYAGTGNTVLDQFGTNAYTNNNGNNNWATNWVETDAGGGGATGGSIQVTGGQLRITDNAAGTQNIYREVDLSGTPGLNMGMAFLTFDHTTSGNLEDSDTVTLEISANGGGSWTTLTTFLNDLTGTFSADITPYIANNTRIRFTASGFAASEFYFFDNIQIADGPKTAGHWEVRVDHPAGIDINAIGIRAHDGDSGSGGTEMNVYADSMLSLGVNPPSSGTTSRAYTLYPWVTSGCSCSQNDFDRDTNSGDTGSVGYASRTAAFTQTFTTATLSANNVWNRDSVQGWTSDQVSGDYGIWTWTPTISSYVVGAPNGNYETTYVGNFLAGGNPPTANPITAGGNPATFRIYVSTDAGAAPVKPYLEQLLTHNRNFTGPNPPQIGLQTTFTVTVRLVNPTAHAITFSAADLVTANVPGGGVLYGGNDGVSQGSVTTEPAVGGTGNVTWNPGVVAAGATALLHYDVRVTPVSGARIPVTATPASGNGTRAQYVDETGNTTQTRARYLMGGLCELAVTAGLATDVLLSSFAIDARGGGTHIQFETASEAGTLGFHVYRADGTRVNDALIPASLKPHGGKYRLFDSQSADANATYVIEEITANGTNRRYGPLNFIDGKGGELQRNRSAAAASPKANDRPDKVKAVAAMVGVTTTGIVRVSASDLATALGTQVMPVANALAGGRVALTRNGTPIAWTTDGQNLYFYGEKGTSLFSNERVYRVELASGGTVMQSVQRAPASSAVSTFTATHDLEIDAFVATVLPLDPDSDYWFWDFVISGTPYGRKTFAVNIPAVASAANATLAVRLQGAFKGGAHRAAVSVNQVPVGELTWSSFDAGTATLSLPAGVLRDGANEITVEGILAPDAGMDIFYVDGFTVAYGKYARPEAGQIAVRTSGDVVAGPFVAAPMILDISTPAKPVIVQGASFQNGLAGVTLPAAASLFFAEGFVAPSSLRGTPAATLKGKQRADWVIIAPRAMRAPAEALAQLRQRDGLTTFVADLEQVFDEFAGGERTPHAIRDFIRSTRTWSTAPRYFVLAGNGSVDYRGINVSPGVVPPLMTSTPDGLYASDSLFADFNGDRLPDVAIGRIPVTTEAELSSYVAKLEANERIDTATSPIVFSADATDGAVDFAAASARAEQTLTTRPATRVYLDQLGTAAARTALLGAWQAGTPLVSWVGHGGLDLLSSSGVLSSYDAPLLGSSGRLPVLVAMTCTINRFENGFVDPLGVALTREDDAGALAVWSASGLSEHAKAQDIQRTFMRLASQGNPRLGDLVVQSLATHDGDTSSVYLLLGDPAIRLDLPMEVRNDGNPSAGNE